MRIACLISKCTMVFEKYQHTVMTLLLSSLLEQSTIGVFGAFRKAACFLEIGLFIFFLPFSRCMSLSTPLGVSMLTRRTEKELGKMYIPPV